MNDKYVKTYELYNNNVNKKMLKLIDSIINYINEYSNKNNILKKEIDNSIKIIKKLKNVYTPMEKLYIPNKRIDIINNNMEKIYITNNKICSDTSKHSKKIKNIIRKRKLTPIPPNLNFINIKKK